MKVYQVILAVGFTLLFLLVSSCQKEEVVVPDALRPIPTLINRYVPGPGSSDCLLMDCETAIANAKEELMKKAEEECGIFMSAIRCCEANQEVFLMYRVSSDCETSLEMDAPVMGGNTGYAALAPSPIGIELLESSCINGGTSLRVTLKGGALPLPLGPFEVHWWVDYQYQGNDTQIDCVYGTAAQLLIIDHWNDNAKQWYKVDLYQEKAPYRY
ncbi:MAG: hypothetical protein RIC19_24985 [Phaeodactylibacter sp.]|uniref:hypothetical protein n=1 Tax=Phaeodactylibacter sp. TaxID=1940289 RepID=UPI0032EE55FA